MEGIGTETPKMQLNFELHEAATEWETGVIPDIQAQRFAPQNWEKQVPAFQQRFHLAAPPYIATSPIQPAKPLPTARYLRVNPFIKGAYIEFSEGTESLHALLDSEGVVMDLKPSASIHDWLSAIAQTDLAAASTHNNGLLGLKPKYRMSLAGEWFSAQDRWWKLGPRQMVLALQHIQSISPWTPMWQNRKGWSLTGGPSPKQIALQYRRPGDLALPTSPQVS